MSNAFDVAPLSRDQRSWAGCASCHEPIGDQLAVSIGRPSFTSPALFVCLSCLEFSVDLLISTLPHPPPPRMRPRAQRRRTRK